MNIWITILDIGQRYTLRLIIPTRVPANIENDNRLCYSSNQILTIINYYYFVFMCPSDATHVRTGFKTHHERATRARVHFIRQSARDCQISFARRPPDRVISAAYVPVCLIFCTIFIFPNYVLPGRDDVSMECFPKSCDVCHCGWSSVALFFKYSVWVMVNHYILRNDCFLRIWRSEVETLCLLGCFLLYDACSISFPLWSTWTNFVNFLGIYIKFVNIDYWK